MNEAIVVGSAETICFLLYPTKYSSPFPIEGYNGNVCPILPGKKGGYGQIKDRIAEP